MRKIILMLALAFGGSMMARAQTFTEIKGQFKGSIKKDIKLFQVLNGNLQEIARSKPTSKGYFGFSFQPEYEGYYVIGSGNDKQPRDNYQVYVKGNDKINLEINDSTYVLLGGNTPENKFLEQWYQFYYPIRYKALTSYKSKLTSQEFYALLEEKNKQVADWFRGKTSGNPDFDHLLIQTAPYDIALFAYEFLYVPGVDYTESYTAPYYASIDSHLYLNETTPLSLPFGIRITSELLKNKLTSQKDFKYDFDKVVQLIENPQLRGEYILGGLDRINSYEDLNKRVTKYKDSFVTDDQKKRVEAELARLAEFKPGLKGFNFSFPDKDGKVLSLNDLKNKVVLVDVWATWCGPCKAEIPYLQKLEEALQGKDVAFVSISADEVKDKEKWKKFITDGKMGGYQLFGGSFNNELANVYKIKAIPRFMVFDKKGNIVTVDSPRPSDPKLKELIDNELGK